MDAGKGLSEVAHTLILLLPNPIVFLVLYMKKEKKAGRKKSFFRSSVESFVREKRGREKCLPELLMPNV